MATKQLSSRRDNYAPSHIGRRGPKDVADVIRGAARRLGVDPADLGTAISYETAGTFDPWKKGPTTKWGQHRGLIQWGVPQRAKYGVTQTSSWQEHEDAIVGYMKDAGVKPGHGLLDVYSAINAGAVGKYAASDEAAGGAWGTVADKVKYQMAAHRRKAMEILGLTPQQSSAVVKIGDIGPRVASIQQALTDLGLNPGPVNGEFGTETAAAVRQLQSAMNRDLEAAGLKSIKVDGQWGPRTTSATISLGIQTPRDVSLEARDAAAAAAARPPAALPSFSQALAAKQGTVAPRPSLSVTSMTDALTRPTPNLVRDLAPIPERRRFTPNQMVAAVEDAAFRREAQAQAVRAQQVSAAKAIASQTATNAARAAMARQAAVARASTDQLPGKAADDVANVARRVAAPIPRMRPTIQPLTQRTVSDPGASASTSVTMRPVARATTDQLPGKAADDVASAARRAISNASRPTIQRPTSTPSNTAIANSSVRAVSQAPGASLGGYRPTAAASTGRAHTLASTNVSTPKVASVSPTPKATTDVPASLRSNYPARPTGAQAGGYNAAGAASFGRINIAPPARPTGAQLGGYNPAAPASVGRTTYRPAPVAVSTPPPAPKPAFTAPQVAAAASVTPAAPGTLQGYRAALAAQPAAPVAVAPTLAPAPIMAPRVVPVAPPPPPVAVVAPPIAPAPTMAAGPAPRAMSRGPVNPWSGAIANMSRGLTNVTVSRNRAPSGNYSNMVTGTNSRGQRVSSYTDSRGRQHNTTTIAGRDFYSRGPANGGGSTASGSRSPSNSSSSRSTSGAGSKSGGPGASKPAGTTRPSSRN